MIPRMDAMIICDQTRGYLLNPASLKMLTPKPINGAPKYSATIAPIMLSVVPTFSALKIYGSATGKRTLRNISQSVAAYDRMSSSDEKSADVRPRTVLIIAGKNVSTATTPILEAGSVALNHWLN